MSASVTAPSSNRFVAYLMDYASYHKTPGNKMTHHVGIPIIVVAIAGALAKVVLGDDLVPGWIGLDLGLVGWVAATCWYLWLDPKIGVPSSLCLLACYLIGKQAPLWLCAVLFVAGWIIQFIGHIKYEHNRPAFYKNLEHLLIGPVWIFGAWFRFIPKQLLH
ncbi:DUF962 domain-containing protein [bacterium]|jgi:uncharacterized membrane protein YGL010W|nr:DUF962 domain-containing protein [bacterium]